MPLNKQYHPDYRVLYSDVPISPSVMNVLKKSDRKMEYIEWELKHARVRRNRKGEITRIIPPREHSLEQLHEQNQHFIGTALSPEDIFFINERRKELHRCLSLLDKQELNLIHALYHDKLTEREYAAQTGLCQKAVNKRKRRVLVKLKKIFVKF
ncbi:sigma-70 family RNA polymerase sigma factor [Ruminococcaceae bacterium OttesenSCG-928-D13]|nr:sigma-70 family RNA polymerase sigma factor [Ruminococcaceae bacterium OttesenSCG-928-D13]